MKGNQIIKSIIQDSRYPGVRGAIIAVVAALNSCLFAYTAAVGSLPGLAQQGAMFMMCLTLVFLSKPAFKTHARLALGVDLCLTALAVLVFGTVVVDFRNIMARASAVNGRDILYGILACILILEATRRLIGPVMPCLALLFVVYAFGGQYFPGVLSHRGFSLQMFITCMFTTEEGIFGMPASSTANFVIMFVIMGAFLKTSGTGEAFIRFATSIFGRFRGGSAKVSIVSAGLMGMISGSSPANVVATGSFTIPLMKQNGYTAPESGAICAVAATGGQILPPVMGAAAFIMANNLRVSYASVALMAAIPALLYYLSVYWMVDSVSVKRNIARISENQIPSFFRELRENGVLMLPILLLVIQLGVLRFSAQRSAFVTTVAIIVINLFRKKNHYTVVGFVKALIMGTMDALEIVAVCGCAGIMIGIVMRSGLALSFTGALVDLSQGNLLLLLLLAMIASIFLGMGMPTAACYIIVAALAVPAIQTLGVSAQATHMFAFYFGCISSITPPVAIAAFTAAGIAKSKVMQTCLLAVKFGLAGFLVPYLFVYRSGLLLSGSPSQILIDILASGIGVFALSVALGGYFIHTITMVERIFLILICAAILVPEPSSTAVGIALFVIYAGALTVWEKRRRASLTKGA